ncbi:conserved hypothetical protein [Roseibium sp. TrichSKD4]|uniref:hypothetical protein n=1 Tax=Roseibium sp. TrichSKD4 TaxID=744980 RepID=UPI0001E5673B|nr:hypothetical protein [Roseibium sp. TrichSKD4]EFO33657.1 conserved hypothetical protein [Roseibium sp. TrichSKD4]
MKVHILELDNNQTSINRLTAAIGFEELSYSIQWFTPCDFERIQLQLGDIVVGGIKFAQKAMDRLGIDVPTLDSVPTSLLPFARRKIQASNMGEVRALVSNGISIFAKPSADQTKRFDGTLFQSVRDLIRDRPAKALWRDTDAACYAA